MAFLWPDPRGDARRDRRGRGSALSLASRRRSGRDRTLGQGTVRSRALDSGRVDDHAAARAQRLPEQPEEVRAQVPRMDPGVRARAQVQQGPDPRTLPQQSLLWRRRLWDRRRVAQVLRPRGGPPVAGRSGGNRRARQGTVQLFADRGCRGGDGPRGRRAEDDGGNRRHQRERGRRCRCAGAQTGARAEAEQRPLLHRLGLAAARHADRRDRGTARGVDDARPVDAARCRCRDPGECPPGCARCTGIARPRWRGQGDGRRQGLCIVDLQPRDTGCPPAGFGVQAVRVSRRARGRAQARGFDRRRTRDDRRMEPAQ